MIQKDAKAYHVLEILSMAGEVGEDMVSLLIPQPDYRKKILQRLLLENKIVRYQKDGVKGYRLTISGKRWMLQSDYNRFSYFLANGADASMRRSDLVHRKRQHRLAEMMALFFLAGTNLFRDEKPNIFQEQPTEAKLSQSVFYSSREWKDMGSLSTKVISSRGAGVWLTKNAVWLCYHLDGVTSWYGNVEKRADILLRSVLQEKGYSFSETRALLFYSQTDTLILEAKQQADIRDSPFEKFCCVPLDENGSLLLQILENAQMYQCLYQVLTEDLKSNAESNIINDGYNDALEPVLICFDFDIKRLLLFVMQLRYAQKKGEVICFDFQKEGVKQYCDEATQISTVDMEAVRENFF